MGVGSQADIVHLIDFGLSKEFRDPNTHLHIPLNEGLGLRAAHRPSHGYGRTTNGR